MKISVLILNYNGKDITSKAIKSFLASDFPKNDIEIVVVDNASLDGSFDFIKDRFPDVKIVRNENNLGSGGINLGIEYCKGDYIFFTNNDVTIEPDCLTKLYDSLRKNRNTALAAPKYINYFSNNPEGFGTWVSRSFYSGYKKEPSDDKIIPYIGIGLIRKSVLNRLSYLFDNNYFLYAEDLDLGLRIRLLGYDITYVCDAIIYHMHSVTAKNVVTSSKVIYLMERNLLTTFYKICSLKSIMLYLLYVYFMRIIAIVRDLFALKFLSAFARVRAILWVALHPLFLIKKHNETKKIRNIHDKVLFSVFSEKYLFRN